MTLTSNVRPADLQMFCRREFFISATLFAKEPEDGGEFGASCRPLATAGDIPLPKNLDSQLAPALVGQPAFRWPEVDGTETPHRDGRLSVR